MGEKYFFQPLTKEDRISVILYRAGIMLSCIALAVSAVTAFGLKLGAGFGPQFLYAAPTWGALLLVLYFAAGLSVFFIHLYIGKFHRFLKKLYFAAMLCLAALFFLGNGSPVAPLMKTPPYPAILLIPISLCLGFITAKEAFCFKLFEGYMLALIMPAYVLFYASGLMPIKNIPTGIGIIAGLHLFFTMRKIFMPLHYDIGDKSAYQP